ncbi:MAG: nucleoside monophosphate kinase, partial [Paludibacteraceae bacterium]|nr:nucleoside monophosphate kinase [Paludibacteraceae bacterium]
KYNMEAIMIDLLVDEQLLIQRLIERGKVSGRADDNLNTIRHRIAVYHNQTEPIAHYYLHQGNYFAVNGNQPVEDVFLQIQRIVDTYAR